MRNFVTILLLVILFVGVFTPPEAFSDVLSDSCGISQSTHEDVQSSNHTANCDHEGMPCHNCHLGHCAFEVTSSYSALSAPETDQVFDSPQTILLFDFRTTLLRPPIL